MLIRLYVNPVINWRPVNVYLVSPIAQIISSPSKTKLNKSKTDGWMYSKLCLVNIFFLVTTVPVILESLCFVF